ncbi:hypothetical protein HD554DRAFT_2171586 [Boletus coccyginus]|nr:hypothetical protein HD554DRAFT_2171586 [Boletus coccyginus]
MLPSTVLAHPAAAWVCIHAHLLGPSYYLAHPDIILSWPPLATHAGPPCALVPTPPSHWCACMHGVCLILSYPPTLAHPTIPLACKLFKQIPNISTLTVAVDNATPYELWHGHKLDVLSLKLMAEDDDENDEDA